MNGVGDIPRRLARAVRGCAGKAALRLRNFRRATAAELPGHIAVTLLAAMITGFFAAVTIFAKPLDPVKRAISDFSFTDIYYEIQSEGAARDTSRMITIVDLTKLTRRGDIARTLGDIEALKPKVVGMDACFDNEGDDFEGNDSLVAVAEKYKNICWAEKMLQWAGDSVGWTQTIHSFFHEFVDINEGTVNMPRTLYDRMKRKAAVCETCNGERHPSLVAQLACAYAGRDIVGSRTQDVNINFSPTVFRSLQPEEVSSHPELIEDQIVLFGALYEDADTNWSPRGKIAGVELIAYGIQTLLLNSEVRTMPFLPFCAISFIVILLVEILQSSYIRGTASSGNLFVKFVVGSLYVLNILTFLFTSVFIGISFFVFKWFNVSFNLAWALSVIAFLGTSRSMYASIKSYMLQISGNVKFLKRLRL